jgi:hypothetical protein
MEGVLLNKFHRELASHGYSGTLTSKDLVHMDTSDLFFLKKNENLIFKFQKNLKIIFACS